MSDKRPIYPSISQSFGITGIVILGTLFLSPVSMFLQNIIGKDAAMLVYYVLAVGAPFGIVYAIRESKTKQSSFSHRPFSVGIIPFLIIIPLFLIMGVTTPLMELMPMPDFVKKIFEELMADGATLFSFMTLVVAAPILEEFIFRGVILDGLLKKHSPFKAILITSILFGIVHLNPWQFLSAMVVGSFSGWVYYHTRNIIPSIIIHAANNLIPFLSLAFMTEELKAIDTQVKMYGSVTNAALAITAFVLLSVVAIYFLNKQFQKNKIEHFEI